MEKFPKGEHYEVLEKWEDNGQRMRRVQVLATPDAQDSKPVLVEMTEREIRPGVWQKEYGSEKFLREAA